MAERAHEGWVHVEEYNRVRGLLANIILADDDLYLGVDADGLDELRATVEHARAELGDEHTGDAG